MRILYVNHSCVLSINQIRLTELAKFPDTKVALLAPMRWRERDIKKTYTFQYEKENSFKSYPTKPYLNFHPILPFYEPFRTRQILKEIKPDLFHIQEEHLRLSALLLVQLGKPTEM